MISKFTKFSIILLTILIINTLFLTKILLAQKYYLGFSIATQNIIELNKKNIDKPIFTYSSHLFNNIIMDDIEKIEDVDDYDEDNDTKNIDIENIEREKYKFGINELDNFKYFENPFRRFEIIFAGSFAFIFFMHITIIETFTQMAPSDYGENLRFSSFTLPLTVFTFASSGILALAVAIEDYRVVFLNPQKKEKSNNKENTNRDKELNNLSNSNNSMNTNEIVSLEFITDISISQKGFNINVLRVNF